jgi:hypothetical protein
LRPALEDETGGKRLVDLGFLVAPTSSALVPWLLIFFIEGASTEARLYGRLPARTQQATIGFFDVKAPDTGCNARSSGY